jgi:hypothetical protein
VHLPQKMLLAFITLRIVFVIAGIIGDASAVFSQQVLDYVPYTLKLASLRSFRYNRDKNIPC